MDTITHAFAGALLGKSFFSRRGPDPAAEYLPQARVAIFTATIASAFPDIDVPFNLLLHDNMRTLKYHRYVTHSILMMPFWAILIALLIWWLARRVGAAPPRIGVLWLASAVGIGSHILLDVATSFGTMVWSPVSRARISWDIIFIIDFTMTALVLVPQVAAWVHHEKARAAIRASRMWAFFTLLSLGVYSLAGVAGYPFSWWVVLVASAVIGAIFFFPLSGGLGARIRRSTWARAGLVAAGSYLLLCTGAHFVALSRLEKFAAEQKISALSMGALPQAPSMLYWNGLIRTEHGAYRLHENLLSTKAIEYDFFPDSAPAGLLDTARKLPDTQTFLWFARFPVFTFRHIDGNNAIEMKDLQFMMRVAGRTPSFTYRVTFDASGNIVSDGMVRSGR
ncbi:MAG TPA: metal-dependent hydrolase [Candidatus Acidoferrum sp.]|nr:metal-dependent hydrolase [Candidatus Acidoferrum sp.]